MRIAAFEPASIDNRATSQWKRALNARAAAAKEVVYGQPNIYNLFLPSVPHFRIECYKVVVPAMAGRLLA